MRKKSVKNSKKIIVRKLHPKDEAAKIAYFLADNMPANNIALIATDPVKRNILEGLFDKKKPEFVAKVLADPRSQALFTPTMIHHQDLQQRTPLHYAAHFNQIEGGQRLIEAKAKLEAKDCNGETTLHHAAKEDHGGFVNMLLNHGANLSAVTDNQNTALHLALLNKHWITAKILLLKYIDNGAINYSNKDGMTPLLIATGELDDKNADITRLLLDKKADVNYPNTQNGGTPLMVTAENGHIQTASVLLERKADFTLNNKDDKTALDQAIGFGQLEIVQLLIAAKADFKSVGKEGNAPIHLAVANEQAAIVKFLLQKDSTLVHSYDREGNTPLHVCVKTTKSTEIVTLLLQYKADPSFRAGKNKRTAAMLAARFNKPSLLSVILNQSTIKYNFSLQDMRGLTALRLAACFGFFAIGKLLIEAGDNTAGQFMAESIIAREHKEEKSDSNHRSKGSQSAKDSQNINSLKEKKSDSNHRSKRSQSTEDTPPNISPGIAETPFYTAVCNNHCLFVEMLLEHKAVSVNLRNGLETTPLIMAIIYGHSQMANILLKSKEIEVNAVTKIDNNPAYTALQLAVSEGQLSILQQLLKHPLIQVDANTQDRGRSLDIACANDLLEEAKLLIEHKAEIIPRDNPTPLQLAVANGHLRLVKLLVESKADIHRQDEDGQTVLYDALLDRENCSRMLLIVLYLLGKDLTAKLDDNNQTPLHYAVSEKDALLVGEMIKLGVNVNAGMYLNEETPLHQAAEIGECRIAKALIEVKASLNAQLKLTGETPLHLAASKGHLELVQLLVEYKANIHIKTFDGCTALKIAQKQKHKSIIEFFSPRDDDHSKKKRPRTAKPSLKEEAPLADVKDVKTETVSFGEHGIYDGDTESPLTIKRLVKLNGIKTRFFIKLDPEAFGKIKNSKIIPDQVFTAMLKHLQEPILVPHKEKNPKNGFIQAKEKYKGKEVPLKLKLHGTEHRLIATASYEHNGNILFILGDWAILHERTVHSQDSLTKSLRYTTFANIRSETDSTITEYAVTIS